MQAGIWIEQMTTAPSAGGGSPPPSNPGNPRNHGEAPAATAAPGQTGQGTSITLICRAVSLSNVDPSANTGIAYTLQKELQASPYFDPKATQLSGEISVDEASGTFTFGISAVLKKPLKL